MNGQAAGLTAVRELVRSHGGAAQVYLLRDEQVLLDEAVGCEPDSLFYVLSASKPFVALLIHLLAERGRLDLDDPVAGYWPEFGQQGKDGVTIRHVLQHRSGFCATGSIRRDALAAVDWQRSLRGIEQAGLLWPPGTTPAYQAITFGFILGEIVRRVTGAEVGDFLRESFLDPLGLRQTYLGLPDHAWPRHVPFRPLGTWQTPASALFNRRAVRQAVIPSTGISVTASDLARFYRALLRGGELDGVRIMRSQTIVEARRPSADGEIDQVIRQPVRWAQGFQLGGAVSGRMSHPMGLSSSPVTFGHNGSNCCIAWADPGRRLIFVYLTNLMTPRRRSVRHQTLVADAVLAACPSSGSASAPA